MTERPYDAHDYDAALARTRGALDDLEKLRQEVFRPGNRRAMLEVVQAINDRLKAGMEELITRLDRDIVAIEAAEAERRKAEKADQERVELERPALLKLLEDKGY